MARSQLAPAHRHIAVEGEQARRRTARDHVTERCLIRRRWLPAVITANAPVHAPAPTGRSLLAEEVSECWEPIRRERDRPYAASLPPVVIAAVMQRERYKMAWMVAATRAASRRASIGHRRCRPGRA